MRGFDWETAIERVDDREDYGELRMIALGFMSVRLHVLIYAPREDDVRLISLRKAAT